MDHVSAGTLGARDLERPWSICNLMKHWHWQWHWAEIVNALKKVLEGRDVEESVLFCVQNGTCPVCRQSLTAVDDTAGASAADAGSEMMSSSSQHRVWAMPGKPVCCHCRHGNGSRCPAARRLVAKYSHWWRRIFWNWSDFFDVVIL